MGAGFVVMKSNCKILIAGCSQLRANSALEAEMKALELGLIKQRSKR